MSQVIKRPLITEKAMTLAENGQYVFEVNPRANKVEIKKAIEEMFEVDVVSIRTLNKKGKTKMRMTRRGMMTGSTRSFKKAYVTLAEGQSIEIVSGVGGNE